MIIRQGNFLGQQRLDVPHLRALESSSCADFDVGFGSIVAGNGSYVIKGFTIPSYSVGQRADLLVLDTASSSLIHPNASEAGSIFETPSDQPAEVLDTTNPNVQGSFSSSSKNFIGIDLIRSADSNTTDLVQFNNADTDLETGIRVPLARTLGYVIVISTSDFSANPTVCPLAIVATDSTNKVLSVVDARPLLFRLGTGGSTPNSQNVWGWPGGRTTGIAAGDLSIGSFKNWLDAVMTRLFELGGGQNWYSSTADRNVQVHYTSVFTQTGEPYYVSSGNVLWKGASFLFDNSTGLINEIQDQITSSVGLTDLASGDCIYVDLDRSQNRTVALSNPLIAQKGNLNTLGTSSPPGSRYVLAAKVGAYYYTRGQYLPIGSLYRVATTSVIGGVELNATPYSATVPQVATVTGANGFIGGAGLSRYGTGTTGSITIGGHQGVDGQVVLVGPDGNSNVLIEGYQLYAAGTKTPAFQIDQWGDSTGNRDVHIVDFRSADGATTITKKSYVDGQGAIGQTNTTFLPPNDLDNPAAGVGGVVFMRPSKYWHADVAAVYNLDLATLSFGETTYSGQKRLTSLVDEVLTVDAHSLTAGERVLFESDLGTPQAWAGIWIVTDTGSGSTPWILDRPVDYNTLSNVSYGVAVRVSAGGATYGGEYFMMSTEDPFIVDTTSGVWTITDKFTNDQYCVKWGEGSVSVLSESNYYNTWGSQ